MASNGGVKAMLHKDRAVARIHYLLEKRCAGDAGEPNLRISLSKRDTCLRSVRDNFLLAV